MMSWIIILGLLLILFIFYQIFRIGRLVSVASKGKEQKSSLNSINGGLFVLFMVVSLAVFFWYSYTHFEEYTLPLASEHGGETDFLFWVTMGITVVAFALIFIVLFVFTYKYQAREGQKAKFFADNHFLELTWTIVPAIVLAVLIFTGLKTWNKITGPASEDAEVIEVVGQQFGWIIRYPGTKDNQLGAYDYRLISPLNEFGLDLSDQNTFDDFKSLELHLPKGKEVLLKIRAKDVLHSVFLPHFRVKMDAVPGMVTQFKFTPTKTTQEMRDELGNQEFNYELACTEVCGQGHFSMRTVVVVDDPNDYEIWKLQQTPWLKSMLEMDSSYIQNVPEDLREAALTVSGLQAYTHDAPGNDTGVRSTAGSH